MESSLAVLQKARDSLNGEEEIRSYENYMIGAMSSHISLETMETITTRAVEYATEEI